MSDRSQIVNRSAQEHLMYIQEKVNPVLEALVTAVLLERPDDPSFFMLRWLCEQTKTPDAATEQGGQRAGSSSSSSNSTAVEAEAKIEAVQAEIKKLKDRKSELLAEILRLDDEASKPDSVKVAAADAKSDTTKANDESEEEESEDDEMEDMPEPPKAFNRGPRQSVSAEAYGQWNQKAAFVAPVYDKTPEQMSRIESCLEPCFLFHALEKKDRATIVMAFKEKHADRGEKVIQEGDDGESMYLIEAGVAECFKHIGGEEKLVKTCTAGDVFGELALLYNCPRAASVVCKEKCTMWELDRGTFNNIVKDAAANKRTALSEFLHKVPLFNGMDEYELMTIADAMKVETIDSAGSVIIKQGDTGDRFYLVVEGECVAMKAFVDGQEPKKVMTHKVGDYFGELSLVSGGPRAASVITSTPSVELMSMDRKTFKRLMGPVQDVLKRQAVRYEAADDSK
eukprot:TRINITY_DN355_c0_g2_i1.p1 TRINITY_DN355_c0_g2~~TRINITY_DN355_c0_g2_i1.p1  ORF type:complete len:454 (+),score=134.17 TRINITY_DN355_c0_g2_i1:142-1503(+)